MSKCISSHGEYSEHEGTGEYCDWCGDCNHEAIRRNAKIEAFRKTQEIIAGFDHIDLDEARERDDMINTGYLIIELDAEIQDLQEADDD